jgi:hypothetical protein
MITLKFLGPFAALAAMSAPAFAAEYYVVRDPTTKNCRVVEARPTDKTMVVIGDKAYVTREEAEKQVKVVCTKD